MEGKRRKHVYSEYDKVYSLKYHKENKERISIDVNKGERDRYKAFCDSQGEALAAMFRRLMDAEMQRVGWEYKEDPKGEE